MMTNNALFGCVHLELWVSGFDVTNWCLLDDYVLKYFCKFLDILLLIPVFVVNHGDGWTWSHCLRSIISISIVLLSSDFFLEMLTYRICIPLVLNSRPMGLNRLGVCPTHYHVWVLEGLVFNWLAIWRFSPVSVICVTFLDIYFSCWSFFFILVILCRYPNIPEESLAESCPVCRKNCNCKKCLRMEMSTKVSCLVHA